MADEEEKPKEEETEEPVQPTPHEEELGRRAQQLKDAEDAA